MLQNNNRVYTGLQNLGNTCYMNSLLQTLFMTPQFREALFSWEYLDSKHPAQEDCIPLQLQLLFARMQLLSLKQADTRKLIKSFQWYDTHINHGNRDAQESFQQHDVQEFCRVLFDAIQQSCGSQDISKLYESHCQSYVKCLKCDTESVRSDIFMDLSLTVKSEFDNVYNESLEKALKHYLTPDRLTGTNLYMCEKCQDKVEAVKGLRFNSLSEILTIQLNRFELDMETFNRKKVNNWVSYPFILDMNNFMQPFDDIDVKDDAQFLQERDRLLSLQTKQQQQQGPIQDYDDPLRRNKKANRRPSPEDMKSDKQNVTFAVRDDFQSQTKHSQQNFQQQEASIVDLQRSCEQLGQKFDSIKKQADNEQDPNKLKTTFVTSKNPNLILTADEAYDLDNDMLFGNNAFELKDIPTMQHHSKEVENDEDFLFEAQQESHHEGIQDLINQYLKKGPYVYELYSVMIHSGGALGGHYYTYIKVNYYFI